MTPDFAALRFLLAVFGGWVNRRQARVIEYLVAARAPSAPVD